MNAIQLTIGSHNYTLSQQANGLWRMQPAEGDAVKDLFEGFGFAVPAGTEAWGDCDWNVLMAKIGQLILVEAAQRYSYQTFSGQTIVRTANDGYTFGELVAELAQNGDGIIAISDEGADGRLQTLAGRKCSELRR